MTLVSPYIQVVPLTRLKADLDFFTYEIPSDLQSIVQPGILVEIPFRGRVLQGIVIGYTSKPTYQLKLIRRVLEPVPLIREWHLRLTRAVADECFVSWATVLQACVPSKPLKKSLKNKSFEVLIEDSHNLKQAQQPFPILVQQQTLVKYRTEIEKWQYVLDRIQATTGQILLLFPEKNDIFKALPYFASFHEELLIFEPGQGKHALWEQWQTIARNRRRIIMGTRSAVFAPVNNLSLCIFIDEEHQAYKQDEPNPRYHATTVVDLLAKELNTKVIRISRAPRITSLYRVTQGELGFYDLGKHDSHPRITIINMNHELVAHNTSMLGLEAQEAIRTGFRSLVILNKKGYVTGFRCRDCELQGKLDTLMNDGRCPSCQSVRISSIGKGVAYAQQHLKELFPRARIYTLTKDNECSLEDTAALIEHADIIVATDYIFSVTDLSPFAIIIDLSIDQQLVLPSYTAQERAFLRLYGISAQLTNEQQLFVQTRHDMHPVIIHGGNWDLKSMYLEEIAQRKQFGYSPFGRMIRLLCKGRTDEEALIRAESVMIALSNRSITMGSPYLSQQTSRWYIYTIEAKLHKPLAEYQTLKSLPCIIDVDPL